MSTIVRGAWVMAMAPGAELVRDGGVMFSGDGSISAVGPYRALAHANPEARVVGDGNGIVMPGLVNAHTHLTECLIPGMGETAVLWEWFERVVDPAGRVITRDEVRLGTRLKAAEMLRSGITTVNDMSCHRNLGSLASLGAAEGLEDMGMRGIVSFGAEDIFPDAPGPEAFMAEHEALADLTSGMDLVGFRVGVGTVLGISPGLFERTVKASADNDWGVHTHLAEVREEVTASKLEHGCSTIEHSGRIGLLDRPTVAGHCIWCSENDIGLMVDKQVSVAHNPVANMILASGVCPVPRFLSEGLTVALGTDGAASNDNQDMFGVLKTAGLLHKVDALRADALTAIEVMRMATIEGARALGLDGAVGSLEPGKRADVVLLDGNTPELATIHDPWQQVVYCATARCVSDVWVDGVHRVAGGEVAGCDLAALAESAREAGSELAVRAGLGGESVYAGPGTAGPFQGQ